MAGDLGFELPKLGVEVADGLRIAFAELLDAGDEGVREGVGFAHDPIRNTGINRAVPLMPLNMATDATTTHTGNMNQ